MTINVLVVEENHGVAEAPLVEHGRRANAARAARSARGCKSVPTVTLTRRAGRLRVHVAGLEAQTAAERQMTVTRLMSTLHITAAPPVEIVVDEAPVMRRKRRALGGASERSMRCNATTPPA